MNIKDRLLAAADQSPGWRNICTAAHDHIAAQEKRIAELEAKVEACQYAVEGRNQKERIAELEAQLTVRQKPLAWIEHHKGGDNLNWDQVDYPHAKATPLFTHPPAPTNAIDAERYRFLRKLENDKNPDQYDDVVDAAILKGK